MRTSVLTLLSGLLLAAACAPEPPPPVLAVPHRAVVSERSYACAPGRDWSVDDDGAWRMRGLAEVPCWIGEAADGLTFWWTVDGERPPLRFTWDGELLDGVYADRFGWRIRVPAERTAPGHHRLEIRQLFAAHGESGLTTRLTGFGVVEAGRRVPFDVARSEAYRYLGDYLVHGGAGVGEQKRRGVLALGPGEVTLPLTGGAGHDFEVEVENASRSPARFSVSVGDTVEANDVAPGGTALVRLPLTATSTGVRLAVDGDDDGLFLFGAPRVAGRTARREQPPLVLVVTLDTTRRDALGVYGGAAGATPRLDELARTATVFDRAVSTAPWTLPAHASMFTGLYPSRHGAGVGERRLPVDGAPTVAEAYAGAGYLTAGFCGGHLVEHRFGVGRGFALYRDAEPRTTPADRLTDRVLELLRQRAVRDDGFEPTFLFVNYFDPHWPYQPPPAWGERFGEPQARRRLTDLAWRQASEGVVAGIHEISHGRAPPALDDLRWLRAAYHAETAFMDAEIGRLFDALRDLGVWDDALIAVVADHGELLGEGGYFGHAYRLDPELVEVPLIVKWPRQRQGRRVGRLVSVVDLFPTLLAAAGFTPPANDGVPLDAPSTERSRVFYEEHVSRVHGLPNPFMRVASHLWGVEGASRRRVVWEGGQECAERRPAGWASAACGDDGERVLAAVRALLGTPVGEGEAVAGEVSEEERSMLRALGYL